LNRNALIDSIRSDNSFVSRVKPTFQLMGKVECD